MRALQSVTPPPPPPPPPSPASSMEAEDERAPPSREELLALVKSEVKKGGTDPSLETTELDEVSRDAVRRLHNCDINLSRRNLRELGEELIDEMKDVVTRLALHRNHLTGLSGLGPRIQECTMLKYLVLRNNDIREFPRDVSPHGNHVGS